MIDEEGEREKAMGTMRGRGDSVLDKIFLF